MGARHIIPVCNNNHWVVILISCEKHVLGGAPVAYILDSAQGTEFPDKFIDRLHRISEYIFPRSPASPRA